MAFFKKLTCLALAFALFSLHVETGAIAWSSAYALDDQVPQFENVDLPNITNESNNFLNQTNQASTGSQKATNSIDMRSSKQGGGKLTMNQLMVLLILLTGPTVAIGCFNTISGKIFSAGSAIYLVMEIMNYSSYKKAITSTEEMYAELTDNPEVNEEQINAFMTAESMENTAADALKKRAGNTKILAMAVSAAAIAAFAESIWGTSTFVGCAAVGFGTNLCFCEEGDKLIQSCMGAPCSKTKTCMAVASGLPAACLAYNDPIKRPNNTLHEYGPQLYADSSKSDLSIIAHFLKENTDLPAHLNNKDSLKVFAENLFSNFISSAYAEGESPAAKGGILSGLGITGAALGAVLAYYVSTKFTFMNKLGVGWIRGTLFTVLAAFAWGAVAELSKAEEKLRNNANVYKSLHERLRAALESQARMANMGAVNRGIRDRLAKFQGIRDEMNNPKGGAICLVGNLGEQRVDENCSCRKNNSCSKVDLSAVDFGGLGLPGFFGETTGALQSGGNSAFSGNLAGANGAFAGIGNNAANLRKLNDRIKGKAVAQLDSINKGKKKTDLKKLEDSFTSQLEKLAPSIIKSASSKNGSTLAAFGIGRSGLSTSLPSDPSKVTAKSLIASVKAKNSPAINKNGAGAFKFDFADEAGSNTGAGAGAEDMALSQGDALNDFKSNESDISDRPDESIFNIITARYFKSAYPRFFSEDNKEKESLD